jgi:hypothetical protein
MPKRKVETVVNAERLKKRISDPASSGNVESALITRKFWLVKSEPDEFSIDDLAASPNSTGFWDVSVNSIEAILYFTTF